MEKGQRSKFFYDQEQSGSQHVFFLFSTGKTTQSESSNHIFKRNMNTMINLGLAYFHRNYKWGKT